MTGTIVNAAAIAVGGLLGASVGRLLKDGTQKTVMHALGLSVVLIGLKMAWNTREMLLVIVSLVIGAVIGECLRIEDRLAALGKRLEDLVGGGQGDFARGFVRTTLLYCVGAMAITGALEDGLGGNPTILYAKAVLDGVSAIIFATTMGLGVAFSSIPVLLYQGAITIGAGSLGAFLSADTINEVSAAGGILVVGIGLNILDLTRIRVGNLLPSVVVVAALLYLKSLAF
jgi:uncharacterized membrane protein YqgA involved in biofilm formation